MKKSEIEQQVAEIFTLLMKKNVLIQEDIIRELDPKWDSLMHLELVLTLENTFNLHFSAEQIDKLISKSAVISEVIECNGTN